MIDTSELNLTVEDHDKAFVELSFLLDIFADTISDLMGGATAVLGRISGSHIAEKMPIYLEDPDLKTVLDAVAKHFENGFGIEHKCDEDGADISFGRCPIREVCKMRDQELGGDLCKLLHNSFGGIVHQMLDKPLKSTIESTGATCKTRLDFK